MAFYRSTKKQSGGGDLNIDSFEVTTPPTITNYNIDDELDITGIVVTATASGMSGNVKDYCTYSPTVFTEEGTIPVTVSYYNETDTFNVTCIDIGTLEQTSWATIKRVAQNASQYWAVGDTKSIKLNGTIGDLPSIENYSTNVFILGFDHYNTPGIYFGGFMNNNNHLIVISSDSYSSLTDGTLANNYNHWGHSSYGGWKGCDLRYDILGSTDVAPDGYGAQAQLNRVGYDATSTCATNPVANTLMAALPAKLRAVMAPMTVYSDNVGYRAYAADVTSSIDYLPLLSVMEISGSATYCNLEERNHQAQYTYFANGGTSLRSAYGHLTNTAFNYWTRSYRGINGQFTTFKGDNGFLGEGQSAGSRYGLLVSFRVA